MAEFRSITASGGLLSPRLDSSVPLGTPRSAAVGLYALVTALMLAALYIGASVAPVVWDETEGQYAGAAREMWEAGEWLTPTNNDVPRLQKPPLVYWSLLGSYAVFGVNEFAARLPNALASLAWFIVAGFIARDLADGRAGVRAMLILGTSFGTFIFCHIIMPEPFLALFLTATMACVLQAVKTPRDAGIWMTAAWVFMALGSFSKGLHGLVYPLVVMILGGLFLPSARPGLRAAVQWLGPVLFLLLVVPWYGLMEWRFPGFAWDHFVNEQVGHVFDSRWPRDSDPAPLLPFLFQHLALWMPWLLFVPSACLALWNRPPAQSRGHNPAVGLLWIWVLVTFLTVLFSARQDYYTMTCWAALAVLLAVGLGGVAETGVLWRTLPSLAVTVLGLALVAGGALLLTDVVATNTWAAPAENRDNIWNTLNGFSGGTWAGLAAPMLWAGIALVVAGIVGGFFGLYGRMESVYAITAAGMVAVLTVATIGLTKLEDYFTLAPVADTVNRRAQPDALVVYQGQPHLASSLFFYLDRPVHWLDSDPRLTFASREHGIGTERFLSREAFVRQWFGPGSVYFITEEERVPQWRPALRLTPEQSRPIARSGTRVLLWNGRP